MINRRSRDRFLYLLCFVSVKWTLLSIGLTARMLSFTAFVEKCARRTMRKLPIKLGVSLPNRGVLFGLTDVDTILNAAVLAEESRVFESVWFGDSLIHKPRLDSIVMLSAAATRTRKVRLGVICMASFPVRHPVLLGDSVGQFGPALEGPDDIGSLHRRRA